MLQRVTFGKMRWSLLTQLQAAPPWIMVRRWLTASEAATALRPFYFAVHPDLFGQHPKERAINEDSIKHLQQYLESLHNQRRATPSRLTFYVRDTQERIQKSRGGRGLRKVQIELLTGNVRDTVTKVLKSCDLSLDYVNEVPVRKAAGPDRPIRWDPSFYTFYGIPNPFAPRNQPKIEHTLGFWLRRNLQKAHKNLSLVEPVRHQTSRMAATLRTESGLDSVRWDSSWGPAQYRACLLSLSRIIKLHKDHLKLTGRTIVFTNDDTGISLHGDILLRSNDVPENWLRIIKMWESQTAILEEIPRAEKQLSCMLNNVRLERRRKGRLVSASEYLTQVKRLTKTVNRQLTEEDGARLQYADISDIIIVIQCATGSLSTSPQGQVLIPSACPGFMVIDYLNDNIDRLRTTKKQHHRTCEEKTALINRVVEELSLLSLTRDQNVTWQQADLCCTRLLNNPRDIGVSLEGCRLKVAQFYSVMSDGEICIPWNWKGDSQTA